MNTPWSLLAIALCLALSGFMVEAEAAVCTPTLAPRASGPQVADHRFSPSVSRPAYRAGDGRVAVFGEAAMFSAQVSGAERRPMEMNMPGAEQNPQFRLNVMHWLAGHTTADPG